jgi:hypothetical protein
MQDHNFVHLNIYLVVKAYTKSVQILHFIRVVSNEKDVAKRSHVIHTKYLL